MKESFREDNLLFRIGGDEFLVVLNNITIDTAIPVFERFRKKLEEMIYPQIGRLTVSIGVSYIRSSDLPTTIIERADQALYYAKNNGRNRVCSYEDLCETKKLTGIRRKNQNKMLSDKA